MLRLKQQRKSRLFRLAKRALDTLFLASRLRIDSMSWVSASQGPQDHKEVSHGTATGSRVGIAARIGGFRGIRAGTHESSDRRVAAESLSAADGVRGGFAGRA